MFDIDYRFITWLNQYARHSQFFDEFVYFISSNYVLKTGPFVVFLTWYWFLEDNGTTLRRANLISGLIASWTAVLVTRIISVAAPFQERPLRNPDLQFVLPYSVKPDAISGWSSFPSDNATLWFSVMACIFLVSRAAGLISLIHTIMVVAFARMYLGYHYPSDIIAGAIIGVGMVLLSRIAIFRINITRAPIFILNNRPQIFYSIFIFLLFLTATTFEPLYPLARAVREISMHFSLQFQAVLLAS